VLQHVTHANQSRGERLADQCISESISERGWNISGCQWSRTSGKRNPGFLLHGWFAKAHRCSEGGQERAAQWGVRMRAGCSRHTCGACMQGGGRQVQED
jgi:hypothetical protein